MGGTRSSLQLVLLILAGSSTWPACGCQKSPKLVSATGTVLYEGKPLAGATVVFALQGEHTGSTPLAFGTTDAEGLFRLQTNLEPTRTREGALPGEHRVTISKSVPPRGMTEEEFEKASKAATMGVYNPKAGVPMKVELLAPQYSSSQTTTLSANVEAGKKNDLTFELR